MGPHESDGITFRYVGRTWFGVLAAPGKLDQRVPVTWAEFKPDKASKKTLVNVYFHDETERAAYHQAAEPFLVAVVAGYDNDPRRFKEYRGAFRVHPLGLGEDNYSLKTQVIQRIKAEDLPDA